MATVTSLGFSIRSSYDGSGTRAATRSLIQVRTTADLMNNSLSRSTTMMGSLTTAAVALAPALAPIAVVATGVGAATVAMAVSSGSALGIYGAAMGGAIKRTLEMAEAGKRLDPTQKAFVSNVDKMKSAWDKFITSTSPTTLRAATSVVAGITAGISRLKPVVDAVAPSIQRVADAFKNWAAGEGFQRFINVVISQGVPALNSLLNAGRDVLATLGIGFRTFAPEGVKLAQALERGAAAMRSWAENGGFTRFLATVNQHAPQVRQFFDALDTLPPETMQALKSGFDSAGAEDDGVSEVSGSVVVLPRSPQPAKVSAAAAMSAATRAVFFTAPPESVFRGDSPVLAEPARSRRPIAHTNTGRGRRQGHWSRKSPRVTKCYRVAT